MTPLEELMEFEPSDKPFISPGTEFIYDPSKSEVFKALLKRELIAKKEYVFLMSQKRLV